MDFVSFIKWSYLIMKSSPKKEVKKRKTKGIDFILFFGLKIKFQFIFKSIFFFLINQEGSDSGSKLQYSYCMCCTRKEITVWLQLSLAMRTHPIRIWATTKKEEKRKNSRENFQGRQCALQTCSVTSVLTCQMARSMTGITWGNF